MRISILDHFSTPKLKVKCDDGFGLPIYEFLLVFTSNIWSNAAALRGISLEIGVKRSPKVKCVTVIRLPIYAFLLMFNSNKRPNLAPYDIQYISL